MAHPRNGIRVATFWFKTNSYLKMPLKKFRCRNYTKKEEKKEDYPKNKPPMNCL